ncbi:hypothetical protein ACEWPM_019360 [Roseovarius sp. S4756]|uniref:hypothetical protein n=1 Tax=Roseovarius maritimus TaxID=3342637 RepID=UPI003729DF45
MTSDRDDNKTPYAADPEAINAALTAIEETLGTVTGLSPELFDIMHSLVGHLDVDLEAEIDGDVGI